MARKSKRMKLNEAIRQGQAKIAEGLKTGQMRADNLPTQANPRSAELPLDDIAPGRAGFLKSKKKSINGGPLSHKAKLILVSCIAALVLGIWFVAALINSEPSIPPDNPATPGLVNKSDVPEKRESAQKPTVRETGTDVSPPVVSTGDNVIWIQSIPLSRQGELVPVKDFFRRKGIQTEIIEVMSGNSNLAVLVTKAGFEQNPGKRGTEGYKLLQRIKQLGTVYVEETNETKFGAKPFQDALGYKR